MARAREASKDAAGGRIGGKRICFLWAASAGGNVHDQADQGEGDLFFGGEAGAGSAIKEYACGPRAPTQDGHPALRHVGAVDLRCRCHQRVARTGEAAGGRSLGRQIEGPAQRLSPETGGVPLFARGRERRRHDYGREEAPGRPRRVVWGGEWLLRASDTIASRKHGRAPEEIGRGGSAVSVDRFIADSSTEYSPAGQAA